MYKHFLYSLNSFSIVPWIKVRSAQNHFGRNPCCSLSRCGQRSVWSVPSIIMKKSFARIDRKLMLLSLLYSFGSLFLYSLTLVPVLNSLGNLSVCHSSKKKARRPKVVTDWTWSFPLKCGLLQGPYHFSVSECTLSAVGLSLLKQRLNRGPSGISGGNTGVERFNRV